MNRIFALWFVFSVVPSEISVFFSLWGYLSPMEVDCVLWNPFAEDGKQKLLCLNKKDPWKNPVVNPVLQKQPMKGIKRHPSAPVPGGFPDEGRQCLCLEQIPECADGWSSLTAKLLDMGHQQFRQYGTCAKGSWDAGVGRDTTTSFCARQESQNFPGEWDPPRVTALTTAQHHLFASGRNYDICLKTCLFNASNVISSSFKIDSFEALTWGWFSMNIFIFLEWSQVFQLLSWLVWWIFLLSCHQMHFPRGWGSSSLKENYSSVTEKVLN